MTVSISSTDSRRGKDKPRSTAVSATGTGANTPNTGSSTPTLLAGEVGGKSDKKVKGKGKAKDRDQGDQEQLDTQTRADGAGSADKSQVACPHAARQSLERQRR